MVNAPAMLAAVLIVSGNAHIEALIAMKPLVPAIKAGALNPMLNLIFI